MYGGLAVLIERIDGELHAHAKADPRVKVLTALPGVGEFTALVMVAEIGDITPFPTARKLASWAGLTPTVRGSDLKVRHGHISKQGSVWLRWALNQAAQNARRSPDFASTGNTHATPGNPTAASTFPALEDLPPLAGVKLVRPGRCAAAGAPARPPAARPEGLGSGQEGSRKPVSPARRRDLVTGPDPYVLLQRWTLWVPRFVR
jgi:transposase IS116/IS110/IS902 family protein